MLYSRVNVIVGNVVEALITTLMIVTLFGAANLLVGAAVAIARIAIADDPILIAALGLSFGLSGMFAVLVGVSLWRWAKGPLGEMPAVMIACLASLWVFGHVFIDLVAQGIIRLRYISSSRPASVRGAWPRLKVVVALVALAAALTLVDLQTGARGWGLGIGVLILVDGLMHAHSIPLYRSFFCQRLADIEVDPELQASLVRGRISGRVLGLIRRWAVVGEGETIGDPDRPGQPAGLP